MMPWLSVNQTELAVPSAVPTPLLPPHVQRAGSPGAPGAGCAAGASSSEGCERSSAPRSCLSDTAMAWGMGELLLLFTSGVHPPWDEEYPPPQGRRALNI